MDQLPNPYEPPQTVLQPHNAGPESSAWMWFIFGLPIAIVVVFYLVRITRG